MPDTVTPPRSSSRIPSPRSFGDDDGGGGGRKWSHQPHHRRRRTLAGLAILLLVVLVVIAAGSSGGGGTHPVTVHAAGLFTRIQTLSGNGAGSFAGVEHRR